MWMHVSRWGGRVHSTDGAAPGVSIIAWGGHPGVVATVFPLPPDGLMLAAGPAGYLGGLARWGWGCAGWRAWAVPGHEQARPGASRSRRPPARCWAAAAAAARARAPESYWCRLLSRTGSPGVRTRWGCAGVRAGRARRPVFSAASTILGRAESAAAAARPVPLQGGPSTPPSGMNPARFGRPASLAAARPVPLDRLERALNPAGPPPKGLARLGSAGAQAGQVGRPVGLGRRQRVAGQQFGLSLGRRPPRIA